MKHTKALGLAILVAVSDLAAGYVAPALGLESHWWVLIIAAAIAVAILITSSWYNPLRRISWLRHWYYGEIAVYEGFWVSDVDHPDRPYSLSKIYYSHLTNRWICRGYALSKDHLIVASWKAVSIYFDSESKYWFFKGDWHVHQAGSSLPTGHPRDQFFKIRTNPGNTDKLSTIIIDNADAADDKDADDLSKTEVLSSQVRRVFSQNFKDTFHFVPKNVEDLTQCDEADFTKLINKFFPPDA
jgi:hypothetical protein